MKTGEKFVCDGWLRRDGARVAATNVVLHSYSHGVANYVDSGQYMDVLLRKRA